MSAHIVHTTTIDAIVSFAIQAGGSCPMPMSAAAEAWIAVRDADPNLLGQGLLDENYRSVNARYRRDDPVPVYVFRPTTTGVVDHDGTTRALEPLDIIKLCNCLEYQSCEHDGWDTSWAQAFLQSVVRAAVRRLPGYDAAPWGLYPPPLGAASRP